MLLCRLATSTSSGVVGFVIQPFALISSTTASQSFVLRPPSAPSPGTNPWYLDSGASFHMTPHSAHLSSLRPSYHHCTIHTADGSPLSVAGQGTLYSNSFHVSDDSFVTNLTMQLMFGGQITDHDYHVILDPDFYYVQDRHTGHLAGIGPIIVIHSVFESLTDFVFLSMCPPVLSALLMLRRLCHHLLSGIII
jgi:hypothetical protein